MEGERRREWEVRGGGRGRRGRERGRRKEREKKEEEGEEARQRKKGVRCRVLYGLRIYECNAL